MSLTNKPDTNGKKSKDLRFYQFVINSLPTGVLTVNADLKITGFNPWAEQITGYSSAEVMGRFCGDILQGDMCQSQCPLKTVLNGHNPVTLVESTICNKQGERFPVRLNSAGLFDAKSDLIGGVESFHDISRLKTLERERNNIIALFAHDIKSSLSIIGAFVLRLLRKECKINPEKKEKYLGIIKNEASKIEGLISDFLEFSRLQSGKLKPNFTSTALDRELLDLFDAYQIKALQSGLNLDLQHDEQPILIEADATQLRRVFTNLLDNAIKFSKGTGTINVSVKQTEKNVTIQVKDEGIGITPEEIPFIFDPFHRGQSAEGKGGVGLGLTGVKSIVEAHGGKVKVESKAGNGTAFTVILPKKPKIEHEN